MSGEYYFFTPQGKTDSQRLLPAGKGLFSFGMFFSLIQLPTFDVEKRTFY